MSDEETRNKSNGKKLPVSLEIVRAAIGDGDPFSTNSEKLRVVIGSGSGSTIQKYLNMVRAERIQAMQPVDLPIPPMSDEFKAIWPSLFTAAIAPVRARLDAVVAERDGLALTSMTYKQDIDALQETIEEHEQTAAEQAEARALDAGTLADHVRQIADMVADAETVAEAHAAQIAETVVQAEKVAGAHAAAIEALTHVAQLAQRDHEADIGAMQREVDRLTTQIGELRASIVMRDQALGAAQATQEAAQKAAAEAQAALAAQAATPTGKS